MKHRMRVVERQLRAIQTNTNLMLVLSCGWFFRWPPSVSSEGTGHGSNAPAPSARPSASFSQSAVSFARVPVRLLPNLASSIAATRRVPCQVPVRRRWKAGCGLTMACERTPLCIPLAGCLRIVVCNPYPLCR
jgi:hypothetical protein